jgi:hypothetical protein
MVPVRVDRPFQPSQPPRGIVMMWLRDGQGSGPGHLLPSAILRVQLSLEPWNPEAQLLCVAKAVLVGFLMKRGR